nr:immunoglobulin heavy chain junction region [Macaca mulatta]
CARIEKGYSSTIYNTFDVW